MSLHAVSFPRPFGGGTGPATQPAPWSARWGPPTTRHDQAPASMAGVVMAAAAAAAATSAASAPTPSAAVQPKKRKAPDSQSAAPPLRATAYQQQHHHSPLVPPQTPAPLAAHQTARARRRQRTLRDDLLVVSTWLAPAERAPRGPADPAAAPSSHNGG